MTITFIQIIYFLLSLYIDVEKCYMAQVYILWKIAAQTCLTFSIGHFVDMLPVSSPKRRQRISVVCYPLFPQISWLKCVGVILYKEIKLSLFTLVISSYLLLLGISVKKLPFYILVSLPSNYFNLQIKYSWGQVLK